MALFTKRHHNALAEWAREELELEKHAKKIGGIRPISSTIWSLAGTLGYDNPRFDTNKFIIACGLEPLKKIDYGQLISDVINRSRG